MGIKCIQSYRELLNFWDADVISYKSQIMILQVWCWCNSTVSSPRSWNQRRTSWLQTRRNCRLLWEESLCKSKFCLFTLLLRNINNKLSLSQRSKLDSNACLKLHFGSVKDSLRFTEPLTPTHTHTLKIQYAKRQLQVNILCMSYNVF